MKHIHTLPMLLIASAGLAGCFGSTAQRPLPVVNQPQSAFPVVTQSGSSGKPSILINAPVKRVQDVIIDRALERGTTVVGANLTGVTLERPLQSSTPVLEQSCGPHQQGRSVRIYLQTLEQGARQTLVEEERFVIDPGPKVCAVSLTQADAEEATRGLGDLKQQAERRTSSVAANPNAAVRPLAPVPVR